MDRLKLLDAGLRAFDVRLPDVAAPLCVATRYRASSCRLCLDVCPTTAITLAPWLQVEPQRCTSCGACAAACKTGALSFVARSAVLRERLQAVAAGGTRPVVRLACRHAGVGVGADDENGTDPNVIVVRCLGGLSPADLIAAVSPGLVTIDLLSGECGTCADGAAGAAVDALIRSAAETLAALGWEVVFTRGSAPGSGPLEVADAPSFSRRGLFSYVVRGLRRTAAEGIAPQKRVVAELHRQAPPPATRAWLLSDLSELAKETGAGPARLPASLPLGAVSVGSDCDACGLCVRYCPHEALTLDGSRLEVDGTRCTGCGLCAEACPPAALVVEPGSFPLPPRAVL
jgi:ferredoxin